MNQRILKETCTVELSLYSGWKRIFDTFMEESITNLYILFLFSIFFVYFFYNFDCSL